MTKLIFGGLIATVLLGLYVWSIIDAATAARTGGVITADISFLLNSVGALITATVLAVLGATQPGELPAGKTFEKGLTGMARKIAAYMPAVYIFVWIICGVITVLYGFHMIFPAAKPGTISANDIEAAGALNASAKAWLGSAIVAVYAYFGITPEQGSKE
jgi:hypothetical protein